MLNQKGEFLTDFRVEIDNICKNEWISNLKLFKDASVIQTWDFAEITSKSQFGCVSRLVLYRGKKVAAMVQVRIVALPFIPAGIAYVIYGPLWKRFGEKEDFKVFKAVLKALYQEYAVQRKLFLRIQPNIIYRENQEINEILSELGFKNSKNSKKYRTIYLDVTRSLLKIRMGFRKKWRQNLNRSDKKPIEIKIGSTQKEYDDLIEVYSEMLDQKKIISEVNTVLWEKILRKLPYIEKPNLIMGYYKSQPVAGMIISNIGEIGFPILAATNKIGRKRYGSYPIFWMAIKWLKESECKQFDLGGIDPENVPSTYYFKRGLGGREATFISPFEACINPLSLVIVSLAELARYLLLEMKKIVF